MKKYLVSVLIVIAAFAMAMPALAVPVGRTITFNTPIGNVVFSGTLHAGKGIKCMECHATIFKMEQGADHMTMQDINEGKFCGECHNGTRAFKTSDPANCGKCHKK
jgi:c(7)-type cytochrome triheme protein